MFNRLFPKQIDNDYRGHVLAMWLLVPLVALKFLMGLNVAGLNPWVESRFVAQTADGIPLETFGVEAASTVMFMFASWGLALLVLSLLGALALLRYHAMIPLVYLLLSIEQFGRKWIATVNPIVRSAPSDGISFGLLINWGLMAALAVGLLLSLVPSRGKDQKAAA